MEGEFDILGVKMATLKQITKGGERGGTTAEDLRDTLGEYAYDKLRLHFGGREIKIPAFPSDEHPLVKALGRDTAEFLCEEFTHLLIYIPKNGDRADMREEYIRAAIAAGLSRGEIARSLDISMRHLRRITRHMGMTLVVNEASGLSAAEVAEPFVTQSEQVVELGGEIAWRIAMRAKPAGLGGGARKHLVLKSSDRADRTLLSERPAKIASIENIFRKLDSRELTAEEARICTGFSVDEVKRLRRRFAETGTVLPQPTIAPADFNGGLTGHEPLARQLPAPANENRASGL